MFSIVPSGTSWQWIILAALRKTIKIFLISDFWMLILFCIGDFVTVHSVFLVSI
jgi:hypothetical protein